MFITSQLTTKLRDHWLVQTLQYNFIQDNFCSFLTLIDDNGIQIMVFLLESRVTKDDTEFK